MYISVNEAAAKFSLSKRRVQLLCEQGRISGAKMVGGAWLIPEAAPKPADGRRKQPHENQAPSGNPSQNFLTLDGVCKALSISRATAKNWLRLGKIVPDAGDQLFSCAYIEAFVAGLKASGNTKLKSRRNKKSATGKVPCKDYVHTQRNQRLVEALLELDLIEDEQDLRIVLANFAVQLYYQSRGISYSENEVLVRFLAQNHSDAFPNLIVDLIGKNTVDSGRIQKLQAALAKEIHFTRGEDALGFVYISLRDIGQRKSAGAYYTPERLVNKLIESLYESDADLNSKTVCDPCCGTGNFLLALGAKGMDYANLYGQDIDPLGVYLTRINIALMDPEMSAADICSHVIMGNTLFETFDQRFDVVLGNPPWGSDLSPEDASRCRKLFKTATGKSMEAYDLFVEKALAMLRNGGMLAFVLPEAILSVAAHDAVRKLLLDSCSFKFISYLGNVFSGVQCPSILLGVALEGHQTTVGCKVTMGNKSFVISQPRRFEDGTLTLNVSDAENTCLEAIGKLQNVAYLKGNAKFALGIVTGNNKEYLSDQKNGNNEVILKGSDIQRYGITPSGNYIRFAPESFQQVAPIEMYRAKEKLLYRFISEIPVFAYDDQQTLSLNSCNIVIPEIAGLEMKYVLAILNSSVAAYFISKRFNSVKLLRSHIEQMPIPIVPSETQAAIIQKVDRMMASSEDISGLYADLDRDIMGLFHLSAEQIETIRLSLSGKNQFLKARQASCTDPHM